jgi:catechol 2,3-dioxygenase-like lactoylglutathione lyase family enzyme
MRPMLPAKNFDISRQFYVDLGFQPRTLTDNLVEMQLGACTFILQDYYVAQWADNFVIHLRVSDVRLWWDRMAAVAPHYGVKAIAPRMEEWGLVAAIIDPSGVLWQIAESV